MVRNRDSQTFILIIKNIVAPARMIDLKTGPLDCLYCFSGLNNGKFWHLRSWDRYINHANKAGRFFWDRFLVLFKAFDISRYGIFGHRHCFLQSITLCHAARQSRHGNSVAAFFGRLKNSSKFGDPHLPFGHGSILSQIC